MPDVTVRWITTSDYDLVPRLAKAALGVGPTKGQIAKAVGQVGWVGRVAILKNVNEAGLGFLLGVVTYPLVRVEWLATVPGQAGADALAALVTGLRADFVDFDISVRVRQDESSKYEFLARLRDAAGGLKVETNADREYAVLSRAEPVAKGGRRGDTPPVGGLARKVDRLG
jgi:hypothetical protein